MTRNHQSKNLLKSPINFVSSLCPFITLAGGALLLIGISHDSELAALAFLAGLALATLGPILYLASNVLSFKYRSRRP